MIAEVDQAVHFKSTNIASEAERPLHQRDIHSERPHHDEEMTQTRQELQQYQCQLKSV